MIKTKPWLFFFPQRTSARSPRLRVYIGCINLAALWSFANLGLLSFRLKHADNQEIIICWETFTIIRYH